jgi:hypothetical protein
MLQTSLAVPTNFLSGYITNFLSATLETSLVVILLNFIRGDITKVP